MMRFCMCKECRLINSHIQAHSLRRTNKLWMLDDSLLSYTFYVDTSSFAKSVMQLNVKRMLLLQAGCALRTRIGTF